MTTLPFMHLLETAYLFGLADGRVAYDLRLPGRIDPARPPSCRGRDPYAFADYLWDNRAGQPPAGLAASASQWYAMGFDEGRRAPAAHSSSASNPAARAAPSVSTGR